VGPLVVMIHMASVWVPFTSESKEAIADYDEIRKEMRLALMECGRKLGTYLRKRQRMRREGERRDIFERYIGEISKAVNAITGTDARKLYDALLEQARKRTAQADQVLDEDGKVVKDEPIDEDGVIVVESAIAAAPESDRISAPPVPESQPKRGKASAKPAAPAKTRGKRGGDGPSLF
jgi:DNA topoisomerase-6 subunit B